MKKLFMIAAVAALGFGMASCAKEGTTPDNNGKSGLLQIKIKDAGMTRAATPQEESVVNVLEVWVFNDGGEERPATLESYKRITGAEFTPDVDGSHGTQLNVEFGAKDVLVITNADLGNADPTLTMEEVMATAVDQQFNKTNNKGITTGGFVMAGVNLNVTIDGETACEVALDRAVAKIGVPSATAVEAALTRAEWEKLYPEAAAGFFAAVDDAEGESMPGFTFTLIGHAVLNGLPQSHAGFYYTARTANAGYVKNPGHAYSSTIPFQFNNPWLNWDAGEFDLPAAGADWRDQLAANNGATEQEMGVRLRSTADDMMDVTTVNNANMAAWAPYAAWMGTSFGGATAEPVYVYESKPGIMTDPNNASYTGYNHDQLVSYIVGGTIHIDGLQDKTRFWRVDIRSNDGEEYHVIRNSSYSLTVNTIKTIGSATPWDAENEKPIVPETGATPTDFVISINPWVNAPVGNNEL